MRDQLKPTLALVFVATVIAAVWLAVLPRIANRPSMRSHLQWLDDQGVDPSAMYYTDLEIMEEILQRERLRQLRASHQ